MAQKAQQESNPSLIFLRVVCVRAKFTKSTCQSPDPCIYNLLRVLIE